MKLLRKVFLTLIIFNALTACSAKKPIETDASYAASIKANQDNLRLLERLAGVRDVSSVDHAIVIMVGDFVKIDIARIIAVRPDGRLIVRSINGVYDQSTGRLASAIMTELVLSGKNEASLRKILDNEEMYREVIGAEGTCTDSPNISVEIKWQGKTRSAIRDSCPERDDTETLIDSILRAANK